MKALLVVTGRGLGGDASTALNIMKALESKGIKCELALDTSAHGALFKKYGYNWHKIKIPAAGGHAATKITTIKAGIGMINASFKIRSLIKKIKPDFVVGIIGGGAIVGCFGAKISRVPAIAISSTPLDYKICSKLNHVFILPESNEYKLKSIPSNVTRTYFPIKNDVNKGNKDIALKNLKKEKNFDENKKTILFSSGSTIFKGTFDALNKFSKYSDEYNLILIGLPLKEEFMNIIDKNKVIYLGYINWVKDLYDYIDLAVLTDDGMMMQEAIACEVPSIALTKVKYGRYHNMESIFKGAVIESEIDEINEKIDYCFANLDKIKSSTKKYSADIKNSTNKLIENILKEINP